MRWGLFDLTPCDTIVKALEKKGIRLLATLLDGST